jgi:Flp pilus assembly protein TadG
MSFTTIIGRLRSDQRGITVVEFALIAPVFLGLVCGALEMSYDLYHRSVIQGVVQRAARKAAVGGLSSGQVDAYIRSKIKPVLPESVRENSATISIIKKSYYNYSNVGKPEKITKDTVPIGSYNATDCYEDLNANHSYDLATGIDGLGGADDIVYYEVTTNTPRLFPVVELVGASPNITIRTKTVIRNQPFSAQDAPVEVCP